MTNLTPTAPVSAPTPTTHTPCCPCLQPGCREPRPACRATSRLQLLFVLSHPNNELLDLLTPSPHHTHAHTHSLTNSPELSIPHGLAWTKTLRTTSGFALLSSLPTFNWVLKIRFQVINGGLCCLFVHCTMKLQGL